jgi:hypothetical protein
VAGDEVGVHMGEEDVADSDVQLASVVEILRDITLGIDHGSHASRPIGDQVGGVGEAAEVVLLEDHAIDVLGSGTIRM